jgi:hypothetical protein
MGNNQARALPSIRMVTADDEGLTSIIERMGEALGQMDDGENPRDYAIRGPAIIAECVRDIANSLLDTDAFDVIELMRMREMPIFLEGYRESLSEQRPAAVELVALILLTRGQRAPVSSPTSNTRPAALISELHDRTSEMLTLGAFDLLNAGERNEFGPLTSLSAQYVMHDLMVKCKQYSHINDDINESLFSTQNLGNLLLEKIYFSYEDYCSVRDAIVQVRSEKFFAIRDTIGEQFNQRSEMENDPVYKRNVRTALMSLIELPGKRASFTAQEITEASGVPADRTQAVLDFFSLSFNGTDDPLAVVVKFLTGDNPFWSASLIKDEDGNYILTGNPIGTDCFRHLVEQTLKADSKKFRRYEKRRSLVSEQLALKHLDAVLSPDRSYANLKYFRANPGIELSELGPEADDINPIAEQTEADGLFIIEDVAVCVEVKAKSISNQARRGNVQRLSADLRDTVGSATNQALRLENHIRTNRGLWLESREWLDLSGVREVRSVTVYLDDFGPLSTALDELVRAEVLRSDRFPWLVTLHDLSVIAEVIDRPAEFLLYLRRRTESEVSLKFSAIDELDLFMLFLSGGLWVEPDPDRVSREFLGVTHSTEKERRRYQESAIPTKVMTQTDPLDAWVYFQEGLSEVEVTKPSFDILPHTAQLVDFLRDGKKPGWFRFSTDLLNLSTESQESLRETVESLVLATRKDGRHHNSLMAFAGAWGYPTLFMGTKPSEMSIEEASTQLAAYGFAKKHQLRSDRALMVVFDEQQRIMSIRYDNSLPMENKELDGIIAEMGLIPPSAMGPRDPSIDTTGDH